MKSISDDDTDEEVECDLSGFENELYELAEATEASGLIFLTDLLLLLLGSS